MSARAVLVVDDEPDIRGLLQEILEDEGLRNQRQILFFSISGCPIWMGSVYLSLGRAQGR
jgi:CheY-like chemotaxis protein